MHKGSVDTQLIALKSKLVPMNGETIPRLELMASLVLAQVMHSVKNAVRSCIKINNVFCWSDSQVVVYCIYRESTKQNRFIENRLAQIRSLVLNQMWNYCPSQCNPADIVSWRSSLLQVSNNTLWWMVQTF